MVDNAGIRNQSFLEWIAEYEYFTYEYASNGHTGETEMTDRSKMFESKSEYLKAEDIPDGKEFKLTILGN